MLPVTKAREVDDDNWVAIMIVAIIFGVFIFIVLLVMCCVVNRAPAAVVVDEDAAETVDARYKTPPAVLSAHLAASSTGMVFQVQGKFSPSGRPVGRAEDRTKTE